MIGTKRAIRRVRQVAIPLCLWGCSEGVRQAAPVDCDPLGDEGCPAGSHCRILAGGATACLAPTDAGPPCDPASCPPGEACVEVEGLRACHALCTLGGDDCGDGGVCAYGLAEDRVWGICPTACRPGACAHGTTCAPTTAAPYPICVAAGPAQVGDFCAESRCSEGLACLLRTDEPRCARLCDPVEQTPCPGRCTGLIEGLSTLRFCDE